MMVAWLLPSSAALDEAWNSHYGRDFGSGSIGHSSKDTLLLKFFSMRLLCASGLN